MQTIVLYLLKVIIISGILLSYYWIALRNKRFHYYNRFYLLLSLLLSVSLPLFNFSWFAWHSNNDAAIKLLNVITVDGGENETIVTSGYGFDWQTCTILMMIIVTLLLLITSGISIIKIYQLKKKYPATSTNEFDFIQTDLQQAPFSFFKNLFWRNDIQIESETGKQILSHEITHIKQKHSWDKLFVQLTLAFFWMNPFFWLIRKELYLIHEFIADEIAVKEYDATAFAKMLLASRFGENIFAPAQSFNYSPLKRRLLILTNKTSTRFNYARRIMVLPVLAAVLVLFAFKLQKETLAASTIIAAQPFKLVIDAGHGGKDQGAIGLNNLNEKDIALNIAKKISNLAKEYNIDAELTRSADVYNSVQEKAEIANRIKAGALISIHVNAKDAEEKNTSGIEVLLSDQNHFFDQSKILGSAIIQKLDNDFEVNKSLIQKKTGIWILKATQMPALLIECGFIDNEVDIRNLTDDKKTEILARHILEGVAAYANNEVKEQYDVQYEAKGEDKKSGDTTKPKPLYVLDGTIVPKVVVDKLKPENIESMHVLKGASATNKYGEKGKNGVVEIITKKETVSRNIMDLVQIPPKFPGGVDAWNKYLQQLKADIVTKKGGPPGRIRS